MQIYIGALPRFILDLLNLHVSFVSNNGDFKRVDINCTVPIAERLEIVKVKALLYSPMSGHYFLNKNTKSFGGLYAITCQPN